MHSHSQTLQKNGTYATSSWTYKWKNNNKNLQPASNARHRTYHGVTTKCNPKRRSKKEHTKNPQNTAHLQYRTPPGTRQNQNPWFFVLLHLILKLTTATLLSNIVPCSTIHDRNNLRACSDTIATAVIVSKIHCRTHVGRTGAVWPARTPSAARF